MDLFFFLLIVVGKLLMQTESNANRATVWMSVLMTSSVHRWVPGGRVYKGVNKNSLLFETGLTESDFLGSCRAHRAPAWQL